MGQFVIACYRPRPGKEACEYAPLASLEEATGPFANFEHVDL